VVTPWLLAALFAAPPIKGRPDDFIGAVGKFTLSAEILPSRFRLDETVMLTLKLDGAGDVSQVRTPDLSRSKAFAERFDVVGPATKESEQTRVVFDYPIRARSVEVKAVPSVRVSIYDESPPRPQYRLLRTAEIPVEVIPVPAKEAVSPYKTETPAVGPTFGSWTPIVGVVASMIVAVLFLRRSWQTNHQNESTLASTPRRRRGKPIDRPVVFVRAESERWIDGLADALSLAAGKRTSAEIVAAAERLGLGERIIDELKRNLEALDASRFGGEATVAVNSDALQAVKSEIERLVLAGMERSPSPRSARG
jgi:hypothetical protein